MFRYCFYNLFKYLNLGSFEINSKTYSNIFASHPNYTRYCIKGMDFSEIINIESDCLHTCFIKDVSIILEKNICIEKCYNDENFKYEFNKRCYSKCPNGTHN